MNRGFAIAGVLYSVLILFLVLISVMLFNLQNKKTLLDKLKTDTINAVESEANYDYLLSEINRLENEITDLKSSKISTSQIYPVGSIYISVNNVDPSTIYGGTWEKIKDKFMLSSGDTYSLGATGGEATHTLTAAESGQKNLGTLTSTNNSVGHTHTFSGTTSENGSHAHTNSYGFYTDTVAGNGKYKLLSASGNQGWRYDAGQTFTNTTGSHTHTYSGTTSGISANHTHQITINGSNATSAHNNMPPYLVVNVWKRTA